MFKRLLALVAMAAIIGCAGGAPMPPSGTAGTKLPARASTHSNTMPWMATSIVFADGNFCSPNYQCPGRFDRIDAQANGVVLPSAFYYLSQSSLSTYGEPSFGMQADWWGHLWYGGNIGTNPPVVECTPTTRGACAFNTAITNQPTASYGPAIGTDRHGHLAMSYYAGTFWPPASIATYSVSYGGGATYQSSISGSSTTLGSYVTGIAFDPSGNIWVAQPNSIVEFAANANGNVAPLETITSTTPFQFISGIATDKYGDIYVVDSLAGNLQMFNSSQPGGSIAPLAEWDDPNLNTGNPVMGSDIVQADDYNAYVLSQNTGDFYIYAVGKAAPVRTIAHPTGGGNYWWPNMFALK